ELAQKLRAATSPVLVLGPEVDDERVWDTTIALSEAFDLPVWAAPSLSRLPFPNQHPNFRGVLPAGIAPIGQILGSHDLALVIGAPAVRYRQWHPCQNLPETTELIPIGADTAAAARAPFGDALIASPVQTLLALAKTLDVADPAADPGPARAIAAAATSATDGVLHPEEVFAGLRETMPDETRYVVESPSANA